MVLPQEQGSSISRERSPVPKRKRKKKGIETGNNHMTQCARGDVSTCRRIDDLHEDLFAEVPSPLFGTFIRDVPHLRRAVHLIRVNSIFILETLPEGGL